MTALTDLDALVARLNDAAYRFGDSYPVDAARQREAAAALVQLREENSARSDLMQGYLDCWRNDKERAERAEAERNEWKCEALVRRDRIAALEAERDALTKDAARYRWLQLEDRRRKEKP